MLKTRMQDTSIESFYRLQHQLNRRERQLLEALQAIQPASDRDLAYKLDWEPNQVTGRRNALVEKKLVFEHHRAISPITKKRVIYWFTKKELSAAEANAFLKTLPEKPTQGSLL